MDIFIVSLAAFGGGLVVALLGWTESGEKFNVRKFVGSVIRSLVSAIGIAYAADYSGSSGPLLYLLAFLSGAGADAGLKSAGGVILNMINKPKT
ncbi:MAG: hypothetical protein PHZ19_07780 [Candidatus Thermoplasmatota archaeon]|nr:hypothetical protein [Candidatus Thermoplasmatota archaeon]